MSIQNMGKNHFTTTEMQDIDSHLQAIEAIFATKTVGLTAEERQKYGSINEKNKLFVNKVHDFVQSYPQHLAPDVDWAEFQQDYQSRQFLETRMQRIQTLAETIYNNKILHDYDNFSDALAYYDYIQYRENRGVAGAAQLVQELKQFFAKAPREDKNDDTTNTTTV